MFPTCLCIDPCPKRRYPLGGVAVGVDGGGLSRR